MNIAIILAAGKSRRMKGLNKIFCKINGKPLIFYTIKVFERCRQIQKIILVTETNSVEKIKELVKKYRLKKITGVIEGGKERQDSARKGLAAIGKLGARAGDLVLFHNGANPLASEEEISEVIKAAKKYGAALLGQPAKDTIKETDKNGVILKTIPRKNIYLAQTPQAIEYELAKEVFEKAVKDGFRGTDDVSLVERLGKPVKIIPCSYKNIKVTTRDDLKIIKTFIKSKR
ncbi:MAG: 2-C-methyl-D-erythritol 4-phosphate cytidylyltransferase [Candidatus Wildermuthbacteria bacterium]|nr:2-C-methyl-D-erythritol 4-phosphate cytidylyltransferase [Candidatus Wildermuthbacteria bacterium]